MIADSFFRLNPGGWSSFDTLIVLIFNILLACWFVWSVLRRMLRSLNARLDRMDELLTSVENEWRFQHRQGTYVGTVEGLWKVLEIGLDHGGLTNEMRRAIYKAGDEMFAAFHMETAHHDRDAPGAARFWAAEQHDGEDVDSLYSHLAERHHD